MKISRHAALAFVAGLVFAAAAQAHHSFSMFDRETEMHLTGVVSRWAFNNPHAWLYITVENENGEEVEWGFEGNAPPSLVRDCICGDIMAGIKSPTDCTLYGTACVPDAPVGACMVSSEGTCRIWHQYGGHPDLGGRRGAVCTR